MKTLKTKLFGFFILFTIISFTSCIKDDFEQPPIVVPHFTLSSGDTLINIADLKASYAGVLDSIEQNWVIKGTVVANDESGNFYKTIEIQDTTAGIELKLDRSYLYTEFKVGQLIYVKCKGLYMGDYNGLIQLGFIYSGAIGRLPDIMIDEHLFKDGLPATPPSPAILTIPTLSADKISMLVKFQNVHFEEVGLPYSESNTTTNRTIKDEAGNSLILRTSNYANFAPTLIPSGKGDLVGILSKYGSDWQFYIRDLNDLVNWQVDNTTYLIKEGFSNGLGIMTQYSVNGPQQIWVQSSFSGKYFAKMSGYANSTYTENEDWLISPAMNLNLYTDEILNFETAMSYGTAGQGLKVYYSTDYTGSGDPNNATWTELNATLSSGSFVFAQSGDIDLSGINGDSVYIAFKYTCGNTSSTTPTWEVASISVKGKHVK